MSFGTDWVEKKRSQPSASNEDKRKELLDAFKSDSRYGTSSIRPLKSGQMLTSSYSSGRGNKNNPKFIDYDLDEEVDCTNILKAIAKSHPVVVTGIPVIKYIPMYRHPLPVSKHRHEHTMVLTRVLSCPLHKQAAAAVTFSDPWTLEEIYMRGAPVDRKEANGYTPLHIACEGNKIECVMVLLNIGVDVNATSLAGITPLYLARASRAYEVEILLREKDAKLETEKDKFVFSSTIMSSSQLFSAPPELTLSKMPVKSRRPGEMEERHFSY